MSHHLPDTHHDWDTVGAGVGVIAATVAAALGMLLLSVGPFTPGRATIGASGSSSKHSPSTVAPTRGGSPREKHQANHSHPSVEISPRSFFRRNFALQTCFAAAGFTHPCW